MQNLLPGLALNSSTDLSSPSNREMVRKHLEALDQRLLSEPELRQYFEVLKVFVSAFIQKVNTLEHSITEIQREQELNQKRMENLYLQSRLEIQSLKSEIKQQRLSKRRFSQILDVAETLKGNPYAPYAIRGLLKETSGEDREAELPADFAQRLAFAQENGFRWNQNNRAPHKKSKQLIILEKWEEEFCKVKNYGAEQLVDKNFIRSAGAGAIAGALIALEGELGAPLTERKELSIYNCYLKAVKMVREKRLEGRWRTDHSAFLGLFHPSHHAELKQKLSSAKIEKAEDYVRFAKRTCTSALLPLFAKTTSDLYKLQAGEFDSNFLAL